MNHITRSDDEFFPTHRPTYVSGNSAAVALRMVPPVVQGHRLRIRAAPVLLPLQARPGGQLPRALSLDLVLVLVLLGVVLVGHRRHLLGEGHGLRAHLFVVDDDLGGQVVGFVGGALELAEGEGRGRQGGGFEQAQALEI